MGSLAPPDAAGDNANMTKPSGAMRPRALEPGARVALLAPAGPVDAERIEASTARCRALGLEPVVFPSAGARRGYLAGTDRQRLADLQAAFDDPAIDAVWALRGGYGSLRIVESLDLSRQRRAPIPFIGFSDNTSLHARHAGLGVVSFHGPHPGGDFPAETEAAFRRVLFRTDAPGTLPRRPGDPEPATLVPGRVEAPLVGGNLAMLAAMCGTPLSLRARGAILVLEDVGEPAYKVDRMLLQLDRTGVLAGVAGLALGRFTDAPDDARYPVRGVLEEVAGRLGVPTVVDLPFGHVEHNWTLPLGALALLDADAASLILTEPGVGSG
jgi:muramoyltetrapeptide carboxypeptidase